MDRSNLIIIRRKPGSSKSAGLLQLDSAIYPCILGRNGITSRKREGDWATPGGEFPVLGGFFRRDRLGFPANRFGLNILKPTDGWCDEPSHPVYNRLIKLPFSASHEEMFRRDGLYDVVLVLDWNFSRRARFRGSAIFIHLIDQKAYTAGCIAIDRKVMLKLLQLIKPQTRIRVLL